MRERVRVGTWAGELEVMGSRRGTRDKIPRGACRGAWLGLAEGSARWAPTGLGRGVEGRDSGGEGTWREKRAGRGPGEAKHRCSQQEARHLGKGLGSIEHMERERRLEREVSSF